MEDEKYKKLLKLIHVYRDEAERAAYGEAYIAACVMIGAALETILKALGLAYKEECIKEERIMKSAMFKLINEFHDAGWLPRSKRLPGNLADEIRKLRNFVHPDCLIDNWPGGPKARKQLYQKVSASLDKIMNVLNDINMLMLTECNEI